MNDTYSFFQLINQYKIEIPIIQRDYAQGRQNAQAVDIRKSIVESLLKATNKENPLSFDFVYGRIDDDSFIPFDGQQRLTTLFLFHLYAFKMCHYCNQCSCVDVLKRFSYRTRQSAREFCEKLVTEKIIPDGKAKISEYIQEQSWFFPEWFLDPTVAGMLNMLEEIQAQYPKDNAVHEKIAKLLTSGCICPITFHFVDMGKQKLQDSTYIKMNARGKTLTAFENFKVSLEQDLRKNLSVNKKAKNVLDVFLGLGDVGKSQRGIDGAWLNFFWHEVNPESSGNLPDSAMYSFFRRHLYNLWILSSEEQLENLGGVTPQDKKAFAMVIDSLNDKLGSQLQDADFISYDIYKQGSV